MRPNQVPAGQLPSAFFDLPQPADFRENETRRLPLTADEQQRVLDKASQDKYTHAHNHWYRWKTIEAMKPQKVTAQQMRAWFEREAQRRLGQPYQVDDTNREIVEALCLYFAEDPEFEARGFGSLNKGILLRGPVGCGKTTLLTIFSHNPRLPYAVHPCRQLSDEYSVKETGGAPALYDYKHLIKIPVGKEAQFNYRTHAGICFDDLGTEDWQAKHMGKTLNVMEDVLCSRDDEVVAGDLPRYATHMTTNLPFNDMEIEDEATGKPVIVKGIESIYGTRCRSRIRGLFNVLTFPEVAYDRRG
ncbi:P-loop NTPase family protein [Hymenobacter metallilatus]|uniref:ATPase n=1 Tax=Hymenobacter metallilatus TaxID=2493666 RepID=A0A3R9M4Z8_9BACT|nr:hypothetical protein [Hymenobacter metallilatus]RSK29870.1 hypothetical protein EI290_16170 [Hymenobacter metallilatus]